MRTDRRRSLLRRGVPALRVAVPLIVVALTVMHLDVGRIGATLAAADAAWAVLAVALFVAGQGLSGVRWGVQSRRYGASASYGWFVRHYLVGGFYNTALPAGFGGDVVRVMALSPFTGRRNAVKSVTVDRASGLAALAVCAALTAPWAGYLMDHAARLLIASAGAASIAITVVLLRRRGMLVWALVTGGYIAVWSAALWTLFASLNVDVDARALPAIILIVGLAMALPVTVGATGTREAGFVLALAPLGIAAETAVAVGVAYGLVLLVVGLVGAPLAVRAPVKPGAA